jgi:ATP-dependent RNA helicase DDX19/DBP5
LTRSRGSHRPLLPHQIPRSDLESWLTISEAGGWGSLGAVKNGNGNAEESKADDGRGKSGVGGGGGGNDSGWGAPLGSGERDHGGGYGGGDGGGSGGGRIRRDDSEYQAALAEEVEDATMAFNGFEVEVSLFSDEVMRFS